MTKSYHWPHDTWLLLGSFGWDEWSWFGRIDIRVEDPSLQTQVDAGFLDVWRLRKGAEYRYSHRPTLTARSPFERSTMSDATRLIIFLVGKMRRYGRGFNYRRGEHLSLGVGFTLLDERDLPVKPRNSG